MVIWKRVLVEIFFKKSYMLYQALVQSSNLSSYDRFTYFQNTYRKIGTCEYIVGFCCAYDGAHFFVLCVDISIKCKYFIEISGICYLNNG